jgi:hypothetical protein
LSARTVYGIETGAYSDWYVDCLFTTRELAEQYIAATQRAAYDRYVTALERHPVLANVYRFFNDQLVGVEPQYGDVTPDSFEDWAKAHGSGMSIGEYQLWSALPVAEE